MKSIWALCLVLAPCANAQSMVFGGDTFITTSHEAANATLPQVVNLEGAWCKEQQGAFYTNKEWRLCLNIEETLNTLSRLKIKAVSLENNHADDAGPKQKAALIARLKARGIAQVSPTKPYCNASQSICAVASYQKQGHLQAQYTIRQLSNRGIKTVHLIHRSQSSQMQKSEADVVLRTGSHQSAPETLALGDLVMDCDCTRGQSRGALVEVAKDTLRYWNVQVPSLNTADQKGALPKAFKGEIPPGAFLVDGFLEFDLSSR